MVKLHLENGQIEELPDLLAVVKNHPEIEEVCLMCRWFNHESRINRSGVWFDYEYEELDWEYSYIGSSEGLEHFAENISVWDDESIGIREGVLYGQSTQYHEKPEGYKEDTLPPCTIEPGFMISADRVRLTAVTLPSGKVINIPDTE